MLKIQEKRKIIKTKGPKKKEPKKDDSNTKVFDGTMFQYLNEDEKSSLAQNRNAFKEKDDSDLDLMERIAKKQLMGTLSMSSNTNGVSQNMVLEEEDKNKEIKRVKTNDFYSKDKKPAKSKKEKYIINSDSDISEDSDSADSDDYVFKPKDNNQKANSVKSNSSGDGSDLNQQKLQFAGRRTKPLTKTVMIEECSDDDDSYYL